MNFVKVSKFTIYDLLNCAPDYGFDNSILMSSLIDMVGGLNDDDIGDYIKELLQDYQYGQEDADVIIEHFEDLKERYRCE